MRQWCTSQKFVMKCNNPSFGLVQLPVIFRSHYLTGGEEKHRPLLIIVYTFSISLLSKEIFSDMI